MADPGRASRRLIYARTALSTSWVTMGEPWSTAPDPRSRLVAISTEVERGDDLLGAKGQGTREARASPTKVRNDWRARSRSSGDQRSRSAIRLRSRSLGSSCWRRIARTASSSSRSVKPGVGPDQTLAQLANSKAPRPDITSSYRREVINCTRTDRQRPTGKAAKRR